MRRRPSLAGLCFLLATLGIAVYLQQTTFAGNFCPDYRQCVVRGGNGYGVLFAVLVPALVLVAVGIKLLWDGVRPLQHIEQ
jgi:hypothetical protein